MAHHGEDNVDGRDRFGYGGDRAGPEGVQSGPSAQGPVTANVIPGDWALKNSQRPSGL